MCICIRPLGKYTREYQNSKRDPRDFPHRMSFETSFNAQQPKLELKLISALSETKRLFLLFCFYIETESFGVSIEPKQTEDQLKQFEREHLLVFFVRKFWVVSVCFGLFQNSSVCFGCFDINLKHQNKPKQTEFFCFWFHETKRNTTQTNLVLVCFGSNRFFFRGHPIIPLAPRKKFPRH
jgi:hypothetical protein